MFPQSIVLKAILGIYLWHAVSSFNLDTRYPIIYEDPSSNLFFRRSYFGYSVVMYAEQGSNNSWIMVGAPRANSTYSKHTDVKEPGVVYKCQLNPYKICQSVLLDATGNEGVGGLSPEKYKDLKDGAWIGASMDIQPGPKGRFVTCGPRWIDQTKPEEYYQFGVCYWIEADNDIALAEKLIPLLNKGRDTYAIPGYKNKNIYDLGVGEAGMSAHMPLIKGTDKKSQLLLGAPGILNWKGGVVLYEDGSKSFGGGHNKRSISVNDFYRLYLPAIVTNSPKFKDFDYMGYQVNSGYFFDENQLLYAASSPRALNVMGKVTIFDLLDPRGRQRARKGGETIMKVYREFYGIQTGEYFGSSLAVCDLNGDDLDDLIIGAPLYAREDITGVGFEEGRVSVLNFNNSISKEIQVIFGSAPRGRFGYAVSCLGDLDSDGFSEFGVGAPYEDDGYGVVYIYYGNEKGIPNKVVQRITARRTHEFLRGFGASITTHTADLDRNGCPDVAVGAFLSGHAVIYRGRPVLRWKITRPRPNPETIPHNATYFNLESVCIHYLGINAPNELDVWKFVELDPTHERCHMKNKTIIENIVHLKRGEDFCETLEIHIKKGIKDILNPVEIKIWYKLKEEKEMDELNIREFETHPIEIKETEIKGKDDFCKRCPISRGLSRSEFLVPFEVECGKDKICHADLSVTGKLPQLQSSSNDTDVSFVIGSSKTLKLKISVQNKPSAEAAYRTSAYVILGYPARISRIPPACTELSGSPFQDIITKGESFSNSSSFSSSSSQTHNIRSRSTHSHFIWDARSISLRCDLDNPLRPSSEREIWVELDMTNAHDATSMLLAAFATTVSNELDLDDNFWSKELPLLFEADITIAGRTAVEQYTYFNESKDDNESKINFIHIYEVQKFGYSPLKKVDIEIQIPVFIQVDGFRNPVNFLTIKEHEANQGGQPLSCILKEEDLNAHKNPTHQNVMAIQGSSEANGSGRSEVPSNRTLYVNCSSTTVSKDQTVICRSIICKAGPLLNSLNVAKVLVSMVIDVKTLQPIMGLRDIILLETRGFVTVIEPAGLIQPELDKPDHSQAITLFIGDIPKKEVESWVLALAIGGGIMILCFLAMALAKAGFFERKKKEELKALKRQTVIETTSDAFKPEDQEIES